MPDDLLAVLEKAAKDNEQGAGAGGWGAGKVKGGWGGSKAASTKGGWGGKGKDEGKPNAGLDVSKLGLKSLDITKCPLFDKVQIKQLAVCDDTVAGQSYVEPFADRSSKGCEEFAAEVAKIFEAEGRKGTCACKQISGH